MTATRLCYRNPESSGTPDSVAFCALHDEGADDPSQNETWVCREGGMPLDPQLSEVALDAWQRASELHTEEICDLRRRLSRINEAIDTIPGVVVERTDYSVDAAPRFIRDAAIKIAELTRERDAARAETERMRAGLQHTQEAARLYREAPTGRFDHDSEMDSRAEIERHLDIACAVYEGGVIVGFIQRDIIARAGRTDNRDRGRRGARRVRAPGRGEGRREGIRRHHPAGSGRGEERRYHRGGIARRCHQQGTGLNATVNSPSARANGPGENRALAADTRLTGRMVCDRNQLR